MLYFNSNRVTLGGEFAKGIVLKKTDTQTTLKDALHVTCICHIMGKMSLLQYTVTF